MKTVGIPEIKPIEKLTAGELCKLPLGPDYRAVLAICIEVTHNSVVLGVLDGAPAEWREMIIQHRQYCASLGTDWILEAGHHDDWVMPRQAAFNDAHGILASEDGPLLAFKINDFGNFAHYRATDMSREVNLGRFISILTKFRIWTSEKHRVTPGAVPVYEN